MNGQVDQQNKKSKSFFSPLLLAIIDCYPYLILEEIS